ncbi:MAG: patatin-like phospholipase family protein [Bacteroidia bacterium]
MIRTIAYLFSLLSLFSPFLLKGQEPERPKIGLALSGGGAKGLAHIGVLKILEENGIRPDYITGTSMGAIIGGLYAIGYSTDQLEAMAYSLEWASYFSDRVPEYYRPIEDKISPAQYQLSFPLFEGKAELPKGLIGGAKLRLLLTHLTIPVHGVNNFDEFGIPFRCVATDLVSGKGIVYREGDLSDAIRCSASIPSVLEPSQYLDAMLVDGGLVRNFPVSDVLEMGADFVIGVDVGAPLYKAEELNSLISILDQTSSFRIVESTAEQRELVDVLIQPKLEGFNALSFERPDSLLLLGKLATLEVLSALKDSLRRRGISDFRPLEKVEPLRLPETVSISEVVFEGDTEATKTTLEQLFRLPESKEMSLDQIDDLVRLLYAAEYFKQVDYRLLPSTNGSKLLVRAVGSREASIKIGVNYDANLKAGLLFNYTRRNWGIQGSRLSLDLKLSEYPIFYGSYRWQTRGNPSLGLRLQGLFNSYPGFRYDPENQRESILAMSYTRFRLEAYSGLSRNLFLGLGIGVEGRIERQKFFLFNADARIQFQPHISLSLLANTLNRQVFPTEGFRVDLHAVYSPFGNVRIFDAVSQDTTIKQVQTNRISLGYLQTWTPIERITFEGFAQGAWSNSTDPQFFQLFFLGRPVPYLEQYLSFSGYRHMERPASAFAFGGIRLRGEVFSNTFAALVFNYGYFQQTAYPILLDGEPIVRVAEQGSMTGLGAEIGYLSPAGPIQFNLEYTPDFNRWTMALSLGYVF